MSQCARSVCWKSGCRVLRKQDASCVWDDAVVSPCGCDARLGKLPWPRFHFVRWRKFPVLTGVPPDAVLATSRLLRVSFIGLRPIQIAPPWSSLISDGRNTQAAG